MRYMAEVLRTKLCGSAGPYRREYTYTHRMLWVYGVAQEGRHTTQRRIHYKGRFRSCKYCIMNTDFGLLKTPACTNASIPNALPEETAKLPAMYITPVLSIYGASFLSACNKASRHPRVSHLCGEI